jgi:hypothetical protein
LAEFSAASDCVDRILAICIQRFWIGGNVFYNLIMFSFSIELITLKMAMGVHNLEYFLEARISFSFVEIQAYHFPPEVFRTYLKL